MPVALVTGTGNDRGIAVAVVDRLRGDGWTVVTSDLDSGDLPCDLTDAEAAAGLVERARREHGTVSGLVLSHALDEPTGILDTTPEAFDRHLAVNARAAMLLIAAFARQTDAAGGAIVAFTSDHTAGNLPYGASKGALDRIVIAAARELGDRGISANVVNPGPVDTGWMDDATRLALTAMQPTGRLGTPADVAGVTAFLLSPAGRWVTGQLLHADGGFSIRL